MSQILLIEDDESLRFMLKMILQQEGNDVCEAKDGKEGLEMCRKQRPDLVLTDIIMPDKEGLETIVELRKEFPKTKIIAMSGGGRFDGTEFLYFARKLGAEKTLRKPFVAEELLKAVMEVIG